jgi:hypothetical protein
MALLAIGSTTLGLALLGLAAFDIWATVLHTGLESPLSNRFHRAGWRFISGVARYVPFGARLREAALPLLVAGLISLWIMLLFLGFAALYIPWLDVTGAFKIADGTTRHWSDALYLSGTMISTLGFSNITPEAWPMRALTVLEGMSGMATISLAIAYVLAVYPTLARLRVSVTALEAEVAGRANGLPLLRRYLHEDGRWDSDLDDRLRTLALELLSLTESHETHPVLYYNHPPRVQQSMLRMLVTTQHLIGFLRYGLSPEDHASLVKNPQVLLLEQAFAFSLRRLAASLHTATSQLSDDSMDKHRHTADFARLCNDLEQLGLTSARRGDAAPVSVLAQGTRYPGLADEHEARTSFEAQHGIGMRSGRTDPALDLASESPVGAYAAFRLATDPYLISYAATSAYSLAEAQSDSGSVWEIADDQRP